MKSCGCFLFGGEYEARTRDLLHAMHILLVFMAFHSFSYRLQQHLSSNFIFHIFAYLCTQ